MKYKYDMDLTLEEELEKLTKEIVMAQNQRENIRKELRTNAALKNNKLLLASEAYWEQIILDLGEMYRAICEEAEDTVDQYN